MEEAEIYRRRRNDNNCYSGLIIIVNTRERNDAADEEGAAANRPLVFPRANDHARMERTKKTQLQETRRDETKRAAAVGSQIGRSEAAAPGKDRITGGSTCRLCVLSASSSGGGRLLGPEKRNMRPRRRRRRLDKEPRRDGTLPAAPQAEQQVR